MPSPIVWRLAFVAVAGAGAVGCGSVSARHDDDGGVGSGDGNGDIDGHVGPCEASQALRCEGTKLVSCNAEGTAEVLTQCALRCNSTSVACEDKVAPSNGYASQLDAAAGQPAISITQNTTIRRLDFNGTSGMVSFGTQQAKAELVAGVNGAPDVVVVSVGSLTVASGVTLYLGYPDTPGGTPPSHRPMAFMSAGDVSIAGTIFVYPDNVSQTDVCNGVTTTAAGADNDYPGGGGGGYGTMGAAGGAIFLVAGGGAGGPVGGTATITPLRGGCRGGNSAGYASAPGDGGGAVQIKSATRIDVGGKIGTPGLGGNVCAGGGAGGGILLEAPVVTLAGGLYANGGAGGCGNYDDDQGNAGQLAMAPATQVCSPISGGQGGYGTTAPTPGDQQSNTTGSNYGAGGGGAVGRIRINTLDMTITGSGEQSPPVTLGPVGSR